jgi:hypothetical protein
MSISTADYWDLRQLWHRKAPPAAVSDVVLTLFGFSNTSGRKCVAKIIELLVGFQFFL